MVIVSFLAFFSGVNKLAFALNLVREIVENGCLGKNYSKLSPSNLKVGGKKSRFHPKFSSAALYCIATLQVI